jgi:hypothetical protein
MCDDDKQYPNVIRTSTGIKLQGLIIPQQVLDHMSTWQTPPKRHEFPSVGEIDMSKDAITLSCSTTKSTATLDDLLSFPQNKPLDVLMSQNARNRSLIKFMENIPLPPAVEREEILRRKRSQIGGALISYIMYGKLKIPIPPEFFLSVTGLTRQDFSLSELSSLAPSQVSVWKMVDLDEFLKQFKDLPKSLQERIAGHVSGNGFLTIAQVTKQLPHFEMPNDDFGKVLYSERCLANAPYISFHPDHKVNPMSPAVRAVYAYIGDILRRSGGDIDTLEKQTPGLFIKPVVEVYG